LDTSRHSQRLNENYLTLLLQELRISQSKRSTVLLASELAFTLGKMFSSPLATLSKKLKIREIATTDVGVKWSPRRATASYPGEKAEKIEGPYFHPDERYDLAALRVHGINAPQIPLFPCLEDPYDNRLLLKPVIVMGFPPIPGSKGQRLCA